MKKKLLSIALSHCEFLKCKEKLFLSQTLDNIQELTVLSIKDLSVIVNRQLRTSFNLPALEFKLEQTLKIMERYGIKSVFINEDVFPNKLKEIPDPPFSLFFRGTLPCNETDAVSMVGTRVPSGDGIAAAFKLGGQFADLNIPVVSGLARGIDTFSQRGCTDSGGISIGVLACSPERIYPSVNVRLAGKIIEHGGCVLSEYPPFTEPLKFRFPQRNRIISGLSRSVIIVEAPKKSGALITADFALEQGRDVFVCKDLLQSVKNAGGAELYDQGAAAISCAADVLNDWNA